MKEHSALPVLIGELSKHRLVLKRFTDFYGTFTARHGEWAAIDTEAAMAIAQMYCNFYTCIETIFFRISAFFENNLEKERWHSHLLERMTCDFPGERPAVIRDETASILQEFLKFRHFTRYYFEFDYDREKLAFLGSAFSRAAIAIERDLDDFTSYLIDLDRGG